MMMMMTTITTTTTTVQNTLDLSPEARFLWSGEQKIKLTDFASLLMLMCWLWRDKER
jgi:hypothetical protein